MKLFFLIFVIAVALFLVISWIVIVVEICTAPLVNEESDLFQNDNSEAHK
jgi:hypothetical protein